MVANFRSMNVAYVGVNINPLKVSHHHPTGKLMWWPLACVYLEGSNLSNDGNVTFTLFV